MVLAENLRYFGVSFKICIDAIEDYLVDGRVYSQLLKSPLPFHDFTRLVQALDKVLDVQNFPQAFQNLRTFESECLSADHPPPPYAALTPEEGLSQDEIAGAAGEKMTFSISVISRRKATWQGLVIFEGEDTPWPFSSDMELFLFLLQQVFSR